VQEDKPTCIAKSQEIGYLTGEENEGMVEAHVQSMFALAEPFRTPTYDFQGQTVTDRVKAQIPYMLKHRLTPPPNETYSLNRKLSGAFLLCAKLGSRVDCQKMLQDIAP
jgi:aarF domain-containing kinase